MKIRMVLAALVVVLAAGCDGGPQPTASPTQSPSPSQTSSSVDQTVPVYYQTETPVGFRLAREFQTADVADGVAATAVQRMLSAPPADPDYFSPWNPATEVLGVDVVEDVIRVDLSDEARTASVGSETSGLAVQQLVYTVTAAEQSDAAVLLLIEGTPAGELWGHLVWDEPISRAPILDVRLLVQINEPAQGATVPTTFPVTGEAATFEAVLPWRIVGADGATALSGTARTAEGQTMAPFDFTIDATGLRGEYTLVVEQDDPSGGEGGPVMSDSKQITIR